MRWIASLAAVVAFGCAGATHAAGVAVVSLIGRELLIVEAQPLTSTNMDRNRYTVVPVKEDVFDRAVFAGVDRVVVARHPNESTALLQVSGSDLGAGYVDGSDGSAATAALVAKVARAATDAGAQRLVLIVPYRAPPAMSTQTGHSGSGHVSGLGLYLDRMTLMQRSDTGASDRGYLGLFANMRIVVVDPRSGAVLGSEHCTVGTLYSTARAPDGHPMNAISGEEKIRVLQGLLGMEIARVLPELLAKAGES